MKVWKIYRAAKVEQYTIGNCMANIKFGKFPLIHLILCHTLVMPNFCHFSIVNNEVNSVIGLYGIPFCKVCLEKHQRGHNMKII